MKELKGSKTEKNLMTAFAGESMARNKYDYYSSQAKKDGYVQIANIFADTALNEKEHAKMWFKLLCEGGKIGDTLANLKAAAAGENDEWTNMYKEFAEVADKEGFADIAESFRRVGGVEQEHEKRYDALIKNMVEAKVFKKDKPVLWMCLNCGHIEEGIEAPEVCPVCSHPQAYFQVATEV